MSDTILRVAWLVLFSLLGLAAPIGVGLAAVRFGPAPVEQHSARLLLGAVLALLISLACGFSLQYGAVYFPLLGEAAQPAWQWEPFGPGSGLLAWAGPGLETAGPVGRTPLFLLQSLGAITVVTLSLAALEPHLSGPGLAGAALGIAGVLYPLLGHWIWGGGWLAATGRTAYLGHGFVDHAGSAGHYALAGTLALAGLLATRARREDGPRGPHLGVALLVLVGMTCLHLGAGGTLSTRSALIAANTWLGAAAAALVAALYLAFTTTRIDPALLARGLLSGAAASAAIAPFAPVTTLLLVGAVAGLLSCLGSYLIEEVWKLDDRIGVVPTFGLGGLWGTIAVGLFADGTFGRGLNGVGNGSHLGVLGQGVTGIALLAAGATPDYGQLVAQLLGAAATAAWGLAPGWLLFRLCRPRQPEQGAAPKPA